MDLTKNEILRLKTKGTLSIVKDSPLHKSVISAMECYAKQESLSFAKWLSNQIIDGRTITKLWDDYQKECAPFISYNAWLHAVCSECGTWTL